VASVDIVMADIRRSWMETGAVIAEVNGKPQLAVRDVPALLKELMPDGGRIPVVMVLGSQDEALYGALAASLAGWGRVGTAWANQVRVGSTVVAKAPSDAFHAGQALLTDPEVDVAVIGFPAGGQVFSGLPVDRFDVLVLAGPQPGTDHGTGWKRWQALALTLAPLCRATIILDSECPQWEPIVAQLDAQKLVPTSHAGLADAVRDELQKQGSKASTPGSDQP
jgi:cyanophycin synthetase